jgi:hypothetical protein
MFAVVAVCSLLVAAQAFKVSPRVVPAISRQQTSLASAGSELDSESSFIERMLAFLLGALPEGILILFVCII